MINYAFIFARAGSKRIKNKNLVLLNSKPLIYYSIEQSLKTKLFKKIFISTDSKKIAKYCMNLNIQQLEIIRRPISLASDTSDEWLSWKHAVKYVNHKYGKFNIFASIPVTSPLRSYRDIKQCVKKKINTKHDIVLTFTSSNRNPYFNMITLDKKNNLFLACKNKIMKKQSFYDLTTVAYVTTPEYILKNKKIWDGRVSGVEIPHPRSLDIDTLDDLNYAKYIMKYGK